MICVKVCLSFYEVKSKQPTWFSNKIERLHWEEWYVNLHVVNSKGHGKFRQNKAAVDHGGEIIGVNDILFRKVTLLYYILHYDNFEHAFNQISENSVEERSSRRAVLETSLRDVLFQIIKFVNERKDHIPQVSNSEVISFPYEITIPRLNCIFPIKNK